MWLQRHLSKIREHPGPTLLSAPVLFGTSHILSALIEPSALIESSKNGAKVDVAIPKTTLTATPERKFVWLELTTNDVNDPIAQGNCLAEAVQTALKYALYSGALHYSYGINVLKSQLETLGPFTFLVSNADYAPEFSRDLLGLHQKGSRVVLTGASPADVFRLPDGELPAYLQVIYATDLKLTLEEALAFTGYLPDADANALLTKTNGIYELFMEAMNEYLSLPLPTRPSPDGLRLAADNEVEIEPDRLLKILMRKEQWLDAFELACATLPDRVPALLGEAGYVYHEKGLHKRLWELLEDLPELVKKDERTIFWRLATAWWLGEAEKVRDEVEERLAHYDAAELRALYAGTIAPTESAETEARRAYEDKKTTITSYQYGRLNSNLTEGLEILRESVKLAERINHRTHIARNTSELTRQLLFLGYYKEALHWGEWTLKKFDEFSFVNSQRKLILMNDWAYAKILTGEITGLEEQLKKVESEFENVLPHIVRNITETLGDYYLAEGKPQEALKCYLKNLDSEERVESGYNARSVVQAHLHMEKPDLDAAMQYAMRAYMLVKGEHWRVRHTSELAYGMVLSIVEPRVGLNQLNYVQDEADKHFLPSYHQAQLALYTAWTHLKLNDRKAAEETLKKHHDVLKGLSEMGLKLLSGPEAEFREIWNMLELEDRPFPLELRFLGKEDVRYKGRTLSLSPQLQEMLILLTLNPKGLSVEKLLNLTTGPLGNLTSFRVMISRLRNSVPLSNPPYIIESRFQADFLQVPKLLEEGNLKTALELYEGPLYLNSESPGVSEARDILEEMMRDAVLAANDFDFLYKFAKTASDDLEVWEATEATLPEDLPQNDKRRAEIAKKLKEIREDWGMSEEQE
ncbi:MAG: hypothetical protein ACRCYY_14115 [Trueperaceae bacterium]